MRRRGTLPLVLLAAAFFGFPFAYLEYHNRASVVPRAGHYLSKEAMGPTAIVRGAYVNSGSKDVGYDDAYHTRHGRKEGD